MISDVSTHSFFSQTLPPVLEGSLEKPETVEEGFVFIQDMEDAVEENMDSGFYLVDLDEANEMMLDLQASHLAKRWGVSRRAIDGYLGRAYQSACSWAQWITSPLFGGETWERKAAQTILTVLDLFKSYQKEIEPAEQVIVQLEGVLEDVSTKKVKDPLAVSRQLVEITTKFFQESHHASKEVKYALAIQSLKEVLDVRNSSRDDFLIRDFFRAIEGMEDGDESKNLFIRLTHLLDPDKACVVSIRDDYKEILGIFDRLALISEVHPFENPCLDEMFFRLLKARWLGTNFGGHLEGLVRLFADEASQISMADASSRMVELDHKIEKADPRRVGKPQIALLKQCLEGELGVKYYTIENVPMVANQEVLRSDKKIIRYRAGCPTIGGSYLNALLKIASFGQTALKDQIAPNYRALIRYMREKNEHILFTVHQTSTPRWFGDESERVNQIFNLGKTFSNFHVVIQSLNPRKGEGYVSPVFRKGEKKQVEALLQNFTAVIAEHKGPKESGLFIPEECRGYDFKELADWIHREIFDLQQEFTQDEWLAFMVFFYQFQKIVIKEELLKKGVNLVATTDPCKDDLDRGGTKWLTEMLLFAISTGQIEDSGFLNYVKSVFLGRPILVKKIGVHPRWIGPAEIILEKCTQRHRFCSIQQKIVSMQSDPVVKIEYPHEQPLLYKFPRQAVNTEELDLFWSHQEVIVKNLSNEDLKEIFIGNFKRSSLDKDAPRIAVQINGEKVVVSDETASIIRNFFDEKVLAKKTDPNKKAYLEEICTQTLFSGKPMRTLTELTPPGIFYQNEKVELYLDENKEGVLQRVKFLPIATGTIPDKELTRCKPLILEIYAPYEFEEGGYYRFSVE